MLGAVATAWGALAVAVWTAPSLAPRAILAWALVFRAVAFFAEPVMEDDHYRFLWDGYRFAETGNPYAETPQAHFGDAAVPTNFQEVLDRINHPDIPTIYGPLCQWLFRLSYAIAPAQLWPWKLTLLGSELAIFWLLWPSLSARGRLLLAWCPLAVFETGFNAHPDALAIALLMAAWWFSRHSRIYAGATAAGLAITAKVFALLLVPFILWRLGRRAWFVTSSAVVLLYAPFWLRGNSADAAGLCAMARDWEFNSSIYAIASALASPFVARTLCALAFGVIWLAVFAQWSSARESSAKLPPGDWIYGGFLLLSTTVNSWYCLWLWPFVASRASAIGINALAAVSLSYITRLNLGDTALGNYEHPPWVRPLEFGLVGSGLCLDWITRRPGRDVTSSRRKEQARVS